MSNTATAKGAPAAPVTAPASRPEPVITPAEPTGGLKLVNGSFNVPTLNKLFADAKSVHGRIPLRKGEEMDKATSKGIAVRRLDAYDWSQIPLEAQPAAKRAVRILLAMQSLETVLKAAQS